MVLFAGRVPNVWLASPFANSGVVQYGSRTRFMRHLMSNRRGEEHVLNLLKRYIRISHIHDLQATSPAQGIDPHYDTPSTWKLNLRIIT
jgi:hypothetical protein